MKITATRNIAAGLIVGVLLVGGAYAQTTKLVPTDPKTGIDKTDTMEMMGHNGLMTMVKPTVKPMHMTGSGMMNGHACTMTCDMKPVGKSKGMTGSMGNGSMGGMMMDKPMKMTGTMTMMGQTYECSMTMTPQGR